MLPLGARAINLVEPDVFRHQFLEVYGKPTRLAVPERKNEGNLGQALHMLVGQTYNDRLSKEGGRLDRSLKSGASDREIIEELYVAGLSRFPTESERSELEKFVQQRASRTEAFRSILWGLITSREFATNH
ncbi:MAG: DUF1553 domain-containing protein [Acidobacteria bacterium]|nr:DUF1553 domain-containing protein [Acidobacteriota bacterium]